MAGLFRQGLFGSKGGEIDELTERVDALETDMVSTKADVIEMQGDVAAATTKANEAKSAVDALDPTEDILYKGPEVNQ